MAESWTVDILLAPTGYSSTCVLLSSPTCHVIVDTGLSLQENELVRALHRNRLEPADIDLVINTHLHVDHCGNNALFPRAFTCLSLAEWRWTSSFYAALFASRAPERVVEEFYPEAESHAVPARLVRKVTKLARRLWNPERLAPESRLRWLETCELPAGLEALPTPGHTPHHVSIRVAAQPAIIIAGDAVLAEDLDARVHTMIPYSRSHALAARDALISRGEQIVPGHGAVFRPGAAERSRAPEK